jgi:hypothetical protein
LALTAINRAAAVEAVRDGAAIAAPSIYARLRRELSLGKT